MIIPEGAILDIETVRALFKTKCHLPIFINGEIPWIVRTGVIAHDNYKENAGTKRTYLRFVDQEPNRYFFMNDTGKFPWGHQDSYLFTNYWLAWAYAQQLNKECIEKNLK